jgi:1,2-diacylglycerol 3-alpha-glucosyltransferase
MRIAFFSDNFYPELSGITDTITTTGKELHSRGHEILYVGPYYSPADFALAKRQFPLTKQDDAVAPGMQVLRLPSLHLPNSPTGQSRSAFPWGETLDEVAEFKPDVIHTQSPYGTGWAAVRVAKRLKIPLVGTNHTAVEDFFPRGTWSAMRHFDAWYYNHCTFVTAPYAKLIDRMREAGFDKPARVLPNPADLHEFTPVTAEERAQHKAAFGLPGPTILCVGRLGVEKRVDILIRATAILLKEFSTLTLVASGHGAARASLESLTQKLGIARHVRFLGYLPRAELVEQYKAADLYAMASTSDSQSLALMQGYASGLPAVCANARGLPDYTPPNCGVLAEPNNPEDFANKIAALLRDETMRAKMGAAAIEYTKQFSPEKIATEWEKIYTDALSS